MLDTEIDITEIDASIAKLKAGKSCGPDGIYQEHLVHSGPIFGLWLKKIFNCIIEFEAMKSSFLCAVTIPIYTGRAGNPLTTNYCGISLTSVISKLF